MLSKELLASLAIWDTALSRVMRRALGLPMPDDPKRPPKVRNKIEVSRGEVMECFANMASPLDLMQVG